MGWFAIAVLAGFFLYVAWHDKAKPVAQRRLIARTIIVAALALAAWTILFVRRHELNHLFDNGVPDGLARVVEQITDLFGSGEVARIILGAILGFGAGYVLHDMATPGATRPLTFGDGDKSGGAGQALIAAGVILLLAIVAPYADSLVRSITKVKAPGLELELSTSARHKIVVTDGLNALFDQISLGYLADYADRLKEDITYLKQIEIPQLEYASKPVEVTAAQQRLHKMEALVPVFAGLISPIARCLDQNIKNGMSISTARQLIRPVADILERIVLHRDAAPTSPSHDLFWTRTSDKFWRAVLRLPAQVTDLQLDEQHGCAKIGRDYVAGTYGFDQAFPRIEDYRDVSYLYTAAALLMTFMTDENLALRILDRYDARLATADYSFLSVKSRLTYYQGFSTDSFAILREGHDRAQAHERELNEYCERVACAKSSIQTLTTREEKADLLFANNMAYFIAEDIARAIDAAAAQSATAERLAAEIKAAAEKPGHLEQDDRDSYTDTWAYVVIVLEAQKRTPDLDKVREATRALKWTVEDMQTKFDRSRSWSDKVSLDIARAHYASARDLGGED